MPRRAASPDPAQRSLFDVLSPGVAPAPVAPAAPAPSAPPSASASPSASSSASPAFSPSPAPSTVEAPPSPAREAGASVFRHPRADREIRLGAHRVGYAFRRAKRRSIGFVVGPDGLAVNAPRWVGVREVEAALLEKADWILRKLVEQRERARRLAASRIEWRDGTSIPFLGETVVVVLDPRAGGVAGSALLDAGADSTAGAGARRPTLRVGLAPDATAEQLRDAVQVWLQRQARRVFEERCRVYADRLGVRWTRLGLSSAQTRWGSANANGAIRLNWRLIHFALPTIDYVVAHELAHLREMNHGPRFWDVVRSVLPDYEAARGALKADAVPLLD